MKINITLFSWFIFVLIALSSCNINRQSNEPNNIIYDSIYVAKVYHLDNDSTKPSCSLKINYVFPVKYVDEKILFQIQHELNYALMEDEKYEPMAPEEAVNNYVEDYINNYKRDAKEQFPDWETSGDTEDYFSYYKTLKTKVLYDLGGLVSYQIVSMDYKGGANSSTAYHNVVIDLKTGDLIGEQDVFLPDYKSVLSAMLIRKIINQNKVQKPDDLLEFGYWGIEDLSSNNNFSLDNKGLTYIFNPGEYSAPSLGEIRVFLSYEELDNILKDVSPISNLAGK